MRKEVITKSYTPPPFNADEALRYARAGGRAGDAVRELLTSLYGEIKDDFSYSVCYKAVDIAIRNDTCDFGDFVYRSEGLSKVLSGCRSAIIFVATVGHKIDRWIAKKSVASATEALLVDAIGSERIEALCDLFESEMAKEFDILPRFSPGYADFPLEAERDIFTLLNPEREIGVFLRESMLMSPTKSVNAIIGIRQR